MPPANQPLEDKLQTVMADVRPDTKPRQSATFTADEPRPLDSLAVADGSCNASTVLLVNYSFKVNITKLFFDGTKPLDKTTFLSLRTLLMTGSNEVP